MLTDHCSIECVYVLQCGICTNNVYCFFIFLRGSTFKKKKRSVGVQCTLLTDSTHEIDDEPDDSLDNMDTGSDSDKAGLRSAQMRVFQQ